MSFVMDLATILNVAVLVVPSVKCSLVDFAVRIMVALLVSVLTLILLL